MVIYIRVPTKQYFINRNDKNNKIFYESLSNCIVLIKKNEV